MNQKLERLWETKNKDDEWWSSFFTSPLAIFANWFVVEVKWLTPNLVTVLSLLVALIASVLIVVGGQINFIIAAVLINVSHILDCMDGQMAKYRGSSSRLGNYFDKVTDQIQIFFWFSAVAYAAYSQVQDVKVVFLAFTGVAFYSLRVYVKYVTIVIEVEHDSGYLEKSSTTATTIRKKKTTQAGLGKGFKRNLLWFFREQRKFFLFNEAVFVFILSGALIFDMLVPMLWVFAGSQFYYGIVRSWQRGRQIHLNQHGELLKPMEK
ncbi:MAG: CDP-alcohol phosphatidyltransferase family protein [Opitutaceae bacterium]|nr:CDP-alcohol phosphatidyltransferase family protein [Opitutaceae bacterium]